MNIIVAGSRTIKDYELVKQFIESVIDNSNTKVTSVISGNAYGVDRLGERWAEENNVKLQLVPANWNNIDHPDAVVKYNQKGQPYNVLAGHWRNTEMAQMADALILIYDGASKGSLNMLQTAERQGLLIFTFVVDIEKHTKQSKQNAKLDAIRWARQMRDDETSLVLDTESCGGSKTDEIISLAVARLHDGKPLFNSLIKPSSDVKFNWHATQVHGITEENLKNQPSIVDVWDEVYELLHKKNVLAFNHVADKRMLEQTFTKNSLKLPEINWHCIMKRYKNYAQSSSVTNLTAACKAMNVKAGTHDALDDALAAARVVHRIAQEYKI